MLYFADKKWWDWHKERAEFKSFAGEKATVFVTGHLVDDPEVHMLRIEQTSGVSFTKDAICTGSNSGQQALNVAVLYGGNPIILVGYDAKDGANKRAHFFGDHPDRTRAPYANQIYEMRSAAKILEEKNIRVINATRDTAIPFFPKMDIEEALRDGCIA